MYKILVFINLFRMKTKTSILLISIYPGILPGRNKLQLKLLPLYANEVIKCKFGLFRSANSNSISLENPENGPVRWEEVQIQTGILP